MITDDFDFIGDCSIDVLTGEIYVDRSTASFLPSIEIICVPKDFVTATTDGELRPAILI